MGCLFSWIRNESHRLFSVMTQSCGVLGKKQQKEKVFWWRPVRRIKAPERRTGIRRERWTVVGLLKDNKLAVLVNAWLLFTAGAVYTWCCFQMFSVSIRSAPGSSERQVNSWLKGREAKGDCVSVSTAELFLGLKAHKEVSCPALKIKRYWLQSETVTFCWDGIYYSEERSTKYYAVCLWGKKKTPTSYKNTFLGWRIWFQLMSHPCVFLFFFFNHLAKKWGF